MKNIFAALVFSFFGLFAFAQEGAQVIKKDYLGLSVDGGAVLNSSEDNILGVGGSVTYATSDLLFGKPKNFITLSLKGFSNPYNGGSLLQSVANKKNDGLNYVAFLWGYRMVKNDYENGLYFEPRIGILQAASYTGGVISPKIGFSKNRFDVSAFAEGAYGGPENNIGEDLIFTAGISLGYNFRLFETFGEGF